MSNKTLTMKDMLTERYLCGVCKGYLSIPPIVYSTNQKIHVCGRCFDEDLYRDDIIERPEDFEECASTQLFPCSNHECDEKVEFGDDAKLHEKSCEFEEIKCPISNFFRGFLKPTEIPCFFRCTDEESMIDHIKDNHSDYILPAPQMIRSSDVLLDSARRRMHILIFLHEYTYKMAVVTVQKRSKTLAIRCRTLMDDSEYCVIEMDPSTSDSIQCFECVPLSKPRYESERDDEVYKIKLSRLQRRIILGFRIEEAETAFVREDEEVLIDAIRSLNLGKAPVKTGISEKKLYNFF